MLLTSWKVTLTNTSGRARDWLLAATVLSLTTLAMVVVVVVEVAVMVVFRNGATLLLNSSSRSTPEWVSFRRTKASIVPTMVLENSNKGNNCEEKLWRKIVRKHSQENLWQKDAKQNCKEKFWSEEKLRGKSVSCVPSRPTRTSIKNVVVLP